MSLTAAITCLALNLYHEARGEGIEGMLAVGAVTLNRTAHPDWPDDVCAVVYQPDQFSWTRAGEPPVAEPDVWGLAVALAEDMIAGAADSVLDERALFYHAATVSPGWAQHKALLGRIGDHLFYSFGETHAPQEKQGSLSIARSIRPVARPYATGGAGAE
jgi:N-acetylmuramoyl-L-alanine amidase